MLTFFCPGCNAEHKSNEIFSGRRAQCVRCGAAMRIPQTSGIKGILIPPPSEEETRVDDDDLDIDELADKYGREPEPEPYHDSALDSGPPKPTTPAEPPLKKHLAKILGSLGLIVLAVGVKFALSAMKAEPPKKAAPPPTTEEEEPPPPVSVATPVPKEDAFVGPPPPPETVTPLTADRLAFEFLTNPAACNQKYAGQLLEVQGVVATYTNGRLGFARTADLARLDDPKVFAAIPALFLGVPERLPLYQSAFGPAAALPLHPPAFRPSTTRPATVVGRYQEDGHLTDCRLTSVFAPADPQYLKRVLTVSGVVGKIDPGDDPSAGTVVTFEPPNTVTRVTVAAQFRATESTLIRTFKPGQPIRITGVCSGRSNLTVKVENCSVGPFDKAVPVTVEQLTRDYELDLHAFPPVEMTGKPLAVPAETLARDCQENLELGNLKYARRYLEVVGRVLQTNPASRTLTFETGTDTKFQVVAVFTPTEFAKIPPDEPVLGVQCVFLGTGGGQVRLESCRVYDPDDRDPTVPRLTTDYFPLAVGTEWQTTRILFQKPLIEARPAGDTSPPAPRRNLQPHTVVRLLYKVAEKDKVFVYLKQQGTTTVAALKELAAKPPKWQKPLKQPTPIQEYRYRVRENRLEEGTLHAEDLEPKQRATANPNDPALWWYDPLLLLRTKLGRTWQGPLSEKYAAAQARKVVTEFTTNAAGQKVVQIDATYVNPRVFGVAGKEARTVIYAKGVGEIYRKSVVTELNYEPYLAVEEQREASDDGEKKGGELRGPTEAPKPREKP